jgi:hypothetical protein
MLALGRSVRSLNAGISKARRPALRRGGVFDDEMPEAYFPVLYFRSPRRRSRTFDLLAALATRDVDISGNVISVGVSNRSPESRWNAIS